MALNFFAEEYANNKGIYPPRNRRSKRTVYVATIEKAANLIYSLYEQNRINELGLIIVDEIHLLGEKGRGCTLETLLSTIMYLNRNIQIVGMSATIGNLQEIGYFLDAYVYTRNFRPVQLTEYVKNDCFLYKINPFEEEMFEKVRVMDHTDALHQKDPDHLRILVGEVADESSCLVFCATKKNCENVAVLLTRVLDQRLLNNFKEERLRLLQIMEGDGGICPILKQTLPYGIAYHHSGLTQEERVLVEDSFRTGTLNFIRLSFIGTLLGTIWGSS